MRARLISFCYSALCLGLLIGFLVPSEAVANNGSEYSASKAFYLVLGSFKDESDAELHRHQLVLEVAMPLEIMPVALAKGTYHRVVYGPLVASDETLLQTFMLLGYSDVWWMMKRRIVAQPVTSEIPAQEPNRLKSPRLMSAPKLIEIQIPVTPPAAITYRW